MKHVVNVSFYIKKNEMKEDGRCPVMARLSVGTFSKSTLSRAQSSLLGLPRCEGGRRSQTSFSTKMTVPVFLWASGRAVGKSQTANEINRRLDEIRASALSHYRQLSAVREHVTAEEVKTLLLGMAFGQETLLAYFRTHNENFDKRVGVNRKKGSATSYWYALGHLTKFLKVKYKLSDIPFTALDRSFIEKYDLHLRIECGLSLGSIVLLATRLTTIVGYAIAEGIITADPFAGYEPERPERQQKYLTREELGKLMTTPLTLPKHYLIRDMFLFSCYTGIPYGDMRRLTDEDISIAEDGEVWIKTSQGLVSDQTIVLTDIKSAKLYPIPLRMVAYRDSEKDITLTFITNNFELSALDVAYIYKNRWQIVVFFKWIKQNLTIKRLWGHSENAVHIHIWVALSAYLIVAYIKAQLNSKLSIYEVMQILSISTFDKTPITELLTEIKSNQNIKEQPNLFD